MRVLTRLFLYGPVFQKRNSTERDTVSDMPGNPPLFKQQSSEEPLRQVTASGVEMSLAGTSLTVPRKPVEFCLSPGNTGRVLAARSNSLNSDSKRRTITIQTRKPVPSLLAPLPPPPPPPDAPSPAPDGKAFHEAIVPSGGGGGRSSENPFLDKSGDAGKAEKMPRTFLLQYFVLKRAEHFYVFLFTVNVTPTLQHASLIFTHTEWAFLSWSLAFLMQMCCSVFFVPFFRVLVRGIYCDDRTGLLCGGTHHIFVAVCAAIEICLLVFFSLRLIRVRGSPSRLSKLAGSKVIIAKGDSETEESLLPVNYSWWDGSNDDRTHQYEKDWDLLTWFAPRSYFLPPWLLLVKCILAAATIVLANQAAYYNISLFLAGSVWWLIVTLQHPPFQRRFFNHVRVGGILGVIFTNCW